MCKIGDNPKRYCTEAVDGSCEGLRRCLEETSCVGLEADKDRGVFISGCDDENAVPVKFCPFCGTEMEIEEIDV